MIQVDPCLPENEGGCAGAEEGIMSARKIGRLVNMLAVLIVKFIC